MNKKRLKDGIITLPFEPALFNRDVEITIVPKQKSEAERLPAGYMSLEEFRVKSKASLTKILNENGINKISSNYQTVS